MERLIKAKQNETYQAVVPPGTLRFLDFARLRLAKGKKHAASSEGREYLIDIFSGVAAVRVEPKSDPPRVFERAGGRADVFSGPPVMVYIPPQCKFEVTAVSDSLDAGIFSSQSDATAPPTVFEGPAIVTNHAGRDNWQRTVYSAVTESFPAGRLLSGETLNPSGNWSSYPPHKHDRNNPPGEAVLEEIYFFRVKPAQGFGFIYTYTAPGDPDGFSNVFVVHDGDTVLLPKGYHPVVAAPGYALHYTWTLAGEERRYGAWADDPQHAWVKGQ